MKSNNEPVQFIMDIIDIVRFVGNEMNKGYANKQNTSTFGLEVLSRLFTMKSAETEEDDPSKSTQGFCVFDVVFRTYMNHKSLKLNVELLEMLTKQSQELICKLSAIRNTNMLPTNYTIKRLEILNFHNTLNAAILMDSGYDLKNGTNYYLDKVAGDIDSVNDLVQPVLECPTLPCLHLIGEIKELLGQNVQQGVEGIIKFCHCLNEYFATIILKYQVAKAKRNRKLMRSNSRGKDNPLSNMQNISKEASKKDRLRRQKSQSKEMFTAKKLRTKSGM